MNYIELKKINIVDGGCEYEVEYPLELLPYIADPSKPFFVKFPGESSSLGVDLQCVPEAILAVPFVGAVLCASMLLNIGIKVPVLDKAFCESISRVEKVFRSRMPYADFCFEVLVDKVVDCSYDPSGVKSLFFTGGVDATAALVEKIDEKPVLVNIWGGDMLLTDTTGHINLEKYFQELTAQVGNDYVFIQSNCRRFFDERNIEEHLHRFLKPEHDHGWWATIAHILSMTSQMAPWLYCNRIGTHYIGSTYPIARDVIANSNNVDMVDAIHIGSTVFRMVDENTERADKISRIIKYCKKTGLKVQVKVCWYSVGSCNCSRCEKCFRTIANILVNHADPNQYGFSVDEAGYRQMHRLIKYHHVHENFWIAIKESFNKERDYWKDDKNISWLLDIEINNPRRIFLYKTAHKVLYPIGKAILRK